MAAPLDHLPPETACPNACITPTGVPPVVVQSWAKKDFYWVRDRMGICAANDPGRTYHRAYSVTRRWRGHVGSELLIGVADSTASCTVLVLHIWTGDEQPVKALSLLELVEPHQCLRMVKLSFSISCKSRWNGRGTTIAIHIHCLKTQSPFSETKNIMIYTVASTVVTGHPLEGQLKNTSALRSARVHEWPQVMKGDLAWDSRTLPSENDTVLTLSVAEVEEVKAAVLHFNREST